MDHDCSRESGPHLGGGSLLTLIWAAVLGQEASSSPTKVQPAAASLGMWSFPTEGIAFGFHLHFLHPAPCEWEQLLVPPPVRGPPLPERRVCFPFPGMPPGSCFSFSSPVGLEARLSADPQGQASRDRGGTSGRGGVRCLSSTLSPPCAGARVPEHLGARSQHVDTWSVSLAPPLLWAAIEDALCLDSGFLALPGLSDLPS